MEARASAKYLRGSAQKARLVIDMIRGKNVNQALAILRYSNKRAALGIEKCVKSAIANANEAAEKANIAVDPDELWLKAAFVDRGPTKHRSRMRPAPQGRAFREQRHPVLSGRRLRLRPKTLRRKPLHLSRKQRSKRRHPRLLQSLAKRQGARRLRNKFADLRSQISNLRFRKLSSCIAQLGFR